MKLIHICGPWPLCTNTFLLVSAAGHAVAIDPAARVQNYLDQLSQAGATLSDIFLTHGHYDHVGGVAELRRRTGAKVHLDLADAKGDQMYPLTPDLIDNPWPAGNSEYAVDELRFQIWHTPGHTPRRRGDRLRQSAFLRRHPLCGQLRPHRSGGRRHGRAGPQSVHGGGTAFAR